MSIAAHVSEKSTGLTCRDIRVAFRGREVLSGIDLDLTAGEWLGLIGPNGAGKSTLLRAIVGLVDAGGTVALPDGRKPRATDIAMVAQAPVLPEGMSVSEYVLLGRTAHLGWLARESRLDRSIVASIIRRLDLHEFAGRLVSTLSGGEAQRAIVARALAQQAPILLLDEPTSALDVGHQMSVLELVDELRHLDGLTVIAVMHDLSTAARYADRLALLDAGHIVAEGPPEHVLEAERLSKVYATSLTVQTIAGELVVLPSPRKPTRGNPPTTQSGELPRQRSRVSQPPTHDHPTSATRSVRHDNR